MFSPCLLSEPLTKGTDLDLELILRCHTVAVLFVFTLFYADIFYSLTVVPFQFSATLLVKGRGLKREDKKCDFHTTVV